MNLKVSNVHFLLFHAACVPMDTLYIRTCTLMPTAVLVGSIDPQQQQQLTAMQLTPEAQDTDHTAAAAMRASFPPPPSSSTLLPPPHSSSLLLSSLAGRHPCSPSSLLLPPPISSHSTEGGVDYRAMYSALPTSPAPLSPELGPLQTNHSCTTAVPCHVPINYTFACLAL